MNKTRRQEAPVATLYDLAEAYQNRDKRAYRRLLENAGVSKELKKKLTTKSEEWRKSKNPEFQEEEIKLLKRITCELNEQIREQEELCENAYQKVQEAQELLAEAQESLKKASQAYEKEKKKEVELKEEEKSTEDIIRQEEKKLKKLQKFILLHPSSTISSLDRRQENMIVCTKFDFDNNKGFSKVVDSIFHCEEGNLLNKADLEQAREEFETLEDFLSAIEYVKMFTIYWAEGIEYELLYNSPGIKKMLDILKLD